MDYDDYLRRWRANDGERQIIQDSLQTLLSPASYIQPDAAAIWSAHSRLFNEHISPMLSGMNTDRVLHPNLQRIGLAKRHPDFEKRLAWILNLPLEGVPRELSDREKKQRAEEVNDELSNWISASCNIPPRLGETFRIYLGYEVLYAYFLSRPPNLPDHIYPRTAAFFRGIAGWAKKTSRFHHRLRQNAGVNLGAIADVCTVLAALERDDRAWLAIFSKMVHWLSEQEEPNRTQLAVQRDQLVADLHAALNQLSETAIPVRKRVVGGLKRFEEYVASQGEEHLGCGSIGRYPDQISSNCHHWMWGKAFCDDVIQIIQTQNISNPQAVLAVLLQPLASRTGRTASGRSHTWSRDEVGQLLLQTASRRRAAIAPLVVPCVERGLQIAVKPQWNALWARPNLL